MARTIPVLSRRILEQSSASDPILVFVSVTHPTMPNAIQLVVDGVDYLINGSTWHQSFFELDLLTDTEKPPQANFRFPNVDRAAITMLQNVSGPCRVEFALLPASYFDLTADPRTVKPGLTVIWDRAPAGSLIYRAQSLFLTTITADQIQVQGTLRSWDFTTESWPDKRATQVLLPGVFAQ
jgi:hypothetical protein